MGSKVTKKKIIENISTIFLLPSIGLKESTKDKFLKLGFKNSYLNCNRLSYNYPVIYLLFQPDNLNAEFYSFYKELSININYIETFDLTDNYTLIVFKIPNKFYNDYQLFLEGKYSQLSEAYKNLFPNSTFVTDSTGKIIKTSGGKQVTEISPFYHIFNRTEYLKSRWKEKFGYSEIDTIFDDIELYEKQDEIKETYFTNLSI